MNVVGHPINSKHLLTFILHNTSDVFIELIFLRFFYKTMFAFYREYKLDVYLRESGGCHRLPKIIVIEELLIS